MRSTVELRRWPITSQQRAAMREAQQRLALVFEHGVTPQQIAQARADIAASGQTRQRQLNLQVRQ